MTQQPWGPPQGQPGQGAPWPGPAGVPQQGFNRGFGQPSFGQQGFNQPWGAPQGGGRMQNPNTVGQYPPPGPFGQPQFGGYPAPMAPKKSSTKPVLLGLGGLVLLVVVAMVVRSLVGGGGVSGYENEDYKAPPPNASPPALPQPQTYQEADQLLTHNKLYQQSVPRPVRCQLKEIQLEGASPSQLKAHMDELTACLMKVWDAPLRAAGYQAVRPVSNVYSGTVTTACGQIPSHNAFYCGMNQQIYYATDLPEIVPPELRNSRFIVESVIAHEFGHAVQGRSGILISRAAMMQKAKDQSEANQWNRRLEVQADCFSGQFLGSIAQSTHMSQSDLDNVKQLFFSIGDDQLSKKPGIDGNHGWGKNRRYWNEMGMASTNIGACNTFSADASKVR